MRRNAARNRAHHVGDHFLRHGLDLVQVARVIDGDRHQDRHLVLRPVVVGHDRLRHLRVRDDDHVVWDLTDRGVAPVDVDDVPLLAGLQRDIISDLDLARRQQMDPGEQVRQRVLKRQRDRQTTDAQRGQDRRDRDAERLQQDQEADDVDEQPAHCDEDRTGLHHSGRAQRIHLDRVGGDARSDHRRRQDHKDEQPSPNVVVQLG